MEGKINILLIEDNPADSELVSIFLKGIYLNRSTLARADSLTMGMSLIEESQFDVIILDLTLPDSWGLETFSKLHAKAPDIPIIVLTGMEDETIGINAVKLGAQDFLLKGKIKGNDLQRSINYSIERHKLIQSLAEKTNALYIEKQKLAEAQKLAHIGSWEWDILNKKITWSDEFFRIHGLKPGEIELAEDTMISNIHPEDVEYIRSIFNNIIKTATQVTFLIE
jgi:two-component system sensor histidine kinase UhpB